MVKHCNNKNPIEDNHSGFRLFKTKDQDISVDVRLEEETVWLTQDQIAMLFGVEHPGITQHIKNIFSEGELQESSVGKKFLRTSIKELQNMNLLNIFNKKEKSSKAPTYQVGQEWYYHTRSVENGSTLKILKIERQEDEERIFHISVLGLHLIHPKHPEGFVEEALHIPIMENALKASTTKLKNDRTHLPDYEFGYMKWKVAFDHKQAGVFRTPVSEIIQFLEDSTQEIK